MIPNHPMMTRPDCASCKKPESALGIIPGFGAVCGNCYLPYAESVAEEERRQKEQLMQRWKEKMGIKQ
mgnify:FL=1